MRNYIFNKIVSTKISRSTLYKKIRNETGTKVFEMIESLDCVGGIINNSPHDSIVYIYRLNELGVSTNKVIDIIKLSKNSCAHFVLLLYIRLSKDFKEHYSFFRTYLKEYKKILIANDQKWEYFDVLVDDLLEKKYFHGIYLPEYFEL
ncbi:hypothetical protein NGRA_0800 [Nosema granulosis]|uniref:Pre-mRNA-splicing factor 38 n=1 Tax=Nosema granulosis TaxID=83296 RepID=A0A9P6GZN3_9MICR|nr:hypothetical protein NGRA_0800 [Nosema granulosis]